MKVFWVLWPLTCIIWTMVYLWVRYKFGDTATPGCMGRHAVIARLYHLALISFGGVVPVRIFLVRCTPPGKWNGLLTTDTGMDFFKAWKTYSRCRALEVVFKDCNANLGFGKCQSTCFASQIAAATLYCMQHNILSVAKRFSDYETIGGLFRDISKETVQLSVAQQIWGILQEPVTAIAGVLGLPEEEVYDVVINHSDEMAHIAKFYKLKSAS